MRSDDPVDGGVNVGSLTGAERAMLEAEGLDPRAAPRQDVIEASAAAYRDLLEGSLSPEAAGQRLGVSAACVRELVVSRRLHGLKPDGEDLSVASQQTDDWLLPRWQFWSDGPGTVPGVEEVIAVLPSDLHPLSVYGFMTQAKPELQVDGEAVSPLRWLEAGGDPTPIVALARDL